MNISLININNILKDFSNVALAKAAIEEKWQKEKRIKESLDLQEFMRELKLQNNIFVFNENNAIPFSKEIVNDNCYIFYCADNSQEHIIKTLVSKIEKIYFDKLLELNKVDVSELVLDGKYQPEFPYFLINKDMYVIGKIA